MKNAADDILRFRGLLAEGVKGKPLDDAMTGVVNALVGDLGELEKRAGEASSALVLAAVDPAKRCGFNCRGSNHEPADKTRHAAFSLVASETAAGVAVAGLAKQFDRLRAAWGHGSGNSFPDTMEKELLEMEAAWPGAVAAIDQVERLVVVMKDFESAEGEAG